MDKDKYFKSVTQPRNAGFRFNSVGRVRRRRINHWVRGLRLRRNGEPTITRPGNPGLFYYEIIVLYTIQFEWITGKFFICGFQCIFPGNDGDCLVVCAGRKIFFCSFANLLFC